MKLTDEERKNGQKSCILSILQIDIETKQFYEIQQLCEAANIQNNDLVNQLTKRRNIGHSFLEMVYHDILLILIEKIMNNSELKDLFQELYKKRFAHAQHIFDIYKQEYESQLTNSQKVIKALTNFNNSENLFFKYNLYRYPLDWFIKEIWETDIKRMDFSSYLDDMSVMEQAREQFTFANTNEPIFTSNLFEKYICRRKLELADFLNIPVEKLEDVIHDEMKSHVENTGTPLRGSIYGKIENCAQSVIMRNNGGMCWYEQITCQKREGGNGFGYRPDINAIIRDYYTSLVQAKYIEYHEKNIPFTKTVLSRECKSERVEEDFTGILYTYELNIFYKMFSLMLEKYYQDFSWEKIINKSLAERYEVILSDLKEIIDNKNNEIKHLTQKNASLSAQIMAAKEDGIKPFIIESAHLNKKIEAQEEKIQNLKTQLNIQNQFIEELLKPEPPEIEEEINLEQLQSKRYLFVGRIDEALPELKQNFPQSLFFTTETLNISNIKIDAIVCLTKWMSHGMYYKIKSEKSLSHIPLIMCNSKNIKRIYWDMKQQLNQ